MNAALGNSKPAVARWRAHCNLIRTNLAPKPEKMEFINEFIAYRFKQSV